MFCTNCGWQNEQGAVFCEKCGQPLESDAAGQPVPKPQSAYVPPRDYSFPVEQPSLTSYSTPPVQQPVAKKKKTGLIVGLSVGGALILTVVILIAALSGESPVEGIWYNEEIGVALEFQGRGFVISYTLDGQDEGNYTFSSGSNKGIIDADGKEYDFRLEGRRITIQGVGTFTKADKNFDVEDFLSEYRDNN